MFSSKVQATLWQSRCVADRRMRVHVCNETELRIAFGNGLEQVNSVLRALEFLIYIHTNMHTKICAAYAHTQPITNRSCRVSYVFCLYCIESSVLTYHYARDRRPQYHISPIPIEIIFFTEHTDGERPFSFGFSEFHEK